MLVSFCGRKWCSTCTYIYVCVKFHIILHYHNQHAWEQVEHKQVQHRSEEVLIDAKVLVVHEVESQYESGDAWNEKDCAQLWPLCFELRLCELTWDPACISVHLRVRVRVYVRRAHRALMIAPKAVVLHIHNKLYHTCEMLHVRAKDTVYAQLLDELLD